MQYEHIATQELTSDSASISFQNIDTIYRFFRLTCYELGDSGGSNRNILFTINNDGGANYTYQDLNAAATVVTGVRNTAQTAVRITGNFGGGGKASFSEILVGKAETSEEARISVLHCAGLGASSPQVQSSGAEWSNTADLINRFDFSLSGDSYGAGTRIILEGARVENA